MAAQMVGLLVEMKVALKAELMVAQTAVQTVDYSADSWVVTRAGYSAAPRVAHLVV